VHRCAVLWRALALVVLVLAAVLTADVVRVRDESPVVQFVGAYGNYHGSEVATLYLFQKAAVITAPADTKSIVLPGRGPCWPAGSDETKTGSDGRENGAIFAEIEEGPPPPPNNWVRVVHPAGSGTDNDFVVADVSGSWASQGPAGVKSVACSMEHVSPARLTFTKYAVVLDFGYETPANDPFMGFSLKFGNKRAVDILRVVPTIPHADAVAMSGAVATGSYADMHYYDRLRIEYNDTVAESRRDILFVVIGALIALGAAMILESLRPIVEQYAQRHP
jgi:hypothetical protein